MMTIEKPFTPDEFTDEDLYAMFLVIMLFGKLNDEGKIEPDESRLHEFFKNLSMD
jgi:hypothetical protein